MQGKINSKFFELKKDLNSDERNIVNVAHSSFIRSIVYKYVCNRLTELDVDNILDNIYDYDVTDINDYHDHNSYYHLEVVWWLDRWNEIMFFKKLVSHVNNKT